MIEGWITKRLGEVWKTTSGGTPSRKRPDFYSGNILWVKSGELRYNTICDTQEKIPKEQFMKEIQLKKKA